MKYYLIAGENSGDLHAANLMKALKQEDPTIKFRYIGGERMKKADGADTDVKKGLFLDIKKLSIMGIWDVLKHIFTLRAYIKATKDDILDYCPDILILVDFAGFNLRIAKFAKKQKIKIIYYISPKIWAWQESRVYKIKRWVDKMYVILPFEPAFYARHDYSVNYLGNPLVDSVKKFKETDTYKFKSENPKKIIALLPGSRKQEVLLILPVMLDVVKRLKHDYNFIVAGVKSVPKLYYKEVKNLGLRIVWDQSYKLLNQSFMALVTSGTATLETAIFGVPQVVCYKTSVLNYWVFKQLIKVPYISLVNLIAEKEVVKELIQQECNSDNIYLNLLKLIKTRERILEDYKMINQELGEFGVSLRIAKNIIKTMSSQ